MRISFALADAATLLTSTAFADITPSAANNAARICESARLSYLERRECRAMFKNAEDQAGREFATRVFYERINGPAPVVIESQASEAQASDSQIAGE